MRVRRAELGKSQEQVALDSGILNQTTVSELEGGRYDLANLTIARLAGLARGLGWTLAQMEVALGVDFGLSSYEGAMPTPRSRPQRPRASAALSAAAQGYHAPPEPLPIPDALREAAATFGQQPEFAPLSELRWQRYLAEIPFRRTPTTPGEWLVVYLNRRDEVDPPEPERD
ncbi:hypothetical protein DEIPH_ctg052orf0053 [Deinococcus phoenicis]|uniref:HTH cro/C1-type domain-containing protein n=1 Tax=Deinococcus phoenicis TaxID=1476583 RepID=A0A016QLS2_9DEIO|nr:helix-turn-helix transcriptional regulator [Deinococcus phoenicis]EYB67055.1 hypothetical protein DEIPH_ctg052orf0053 [Deinococcus phoenicis]